MHMVSGLLPHLRYDAGKTVEGKNLCRSNFTIQVTLQGREGFALERPAAGEPRGDDGRLERIPSLETEVPHQRNCLQSPG